MKEKREEQSDEERGSPTQRILTVVFIFTFIGLLLYAVFKCSSNKSAKVQKRCLVFYTILFVYLIVSIVYSVLYEFIL